MKSVDLRVIVPKSYETARIQQNLKYNNQSQQNLLSVQSNEQLKDLKQKVVKKSKTKDIKLDIKEKPTHKKHKKYRSKKRKNKEKIRKTKNRKTLNKHIDIKI